MRKSRGMAVAVAIACLLGPAPAAAGPLPPCATAAGTPEPAYGALGEAPYVGVWSGVVLGFGGDCPEILNGPAGSVVAISGQFRHDGTLDDLVRARRCSLGHRGGALLVGLGGRLAAARHPVAGSREPPGPRKPGRISARPRSLPGARLYLAQRDGRSHGLNVYSMTAHARDRDRLTLTTVNETGIRFLVATLFEPAQPDQRRHRHPARRWTGGAITAFWSRRTALDGGGRPPS